MSDLELVAQAEMLAYEMRRAIDSIPFTAPECFVDFTRSGGVAINELLDHIRTKDAEINSRAVDQLRLADERDMARAALARRDAAIQAVRDLCDRWAESNGDAMSITAVRAAIAAELEKP